MNENNFNNIKNHLIHIGQMGRLIRFACARYVYLGGEDDIETHARMLVRRTILSLNLGGDVDINDLNEKQLSELISLAKDAFSDFVQLPKERAEQHTGAEIHEILTTGL